MDVSAGGFSGRSTRTQETEYEKDRGELFRRLWFWLGVLGIFAGLVSIAFGISATAMQSHGYWTYIGIWGGVLYILVGCYDVMNSVGNSTRGSVMLMVIMNIGIAVIALTQLILNCLSIQEEATNNQIAGRPVQLSMNSVLAIAALLELASCCGVGAAACGQMDITPKITGFVEGDSKRAMMSRFVDMSLADQSQSGIKY